ncbi:antibiotic biosynthesis monooxygenase family protein [Marinobacter adhaerens]|uniref:antibiotic biosynthesis monooxygenase family protein n=1 Tax=Marinobacter adhaerens TaxID=1033846 RepID=UPI001E3B720E|nr:antibiotic biosynthesis monooxygenase [Marinobacter adhaerens]MCD1647267.1 antibiotic biosynthesis monooxygenase [Marinobacter adhaerens]
MAIKRIWHGWTTLENANHYERLLDSEVFPGIEAKAIPGYLGIELLRRNLDQEVEFITVMTFESLDDVKAFQGEDYSRAYIPARARDLLKRWDDASSHYEVIQQRF